jgi:hopanoid biosynthesis associated RND transporter like protein HpnN
MDLSVNTSTDEILSSRLPFRQTEIAYEKSFPAADLAIVVVDAATPAGAQAAAEDMVRRLDASSHFADVELAGSSPFFDRIGLLFLDPDAIRQVGVELRQARRLMLTLADDPTLRGMADFLGLARQGVEEGAAPASLGKLLAALAATVEARAGGQAASVDWRALLGFEQGDDSTRRIIRTKPILDNDSFDRAGAALADIKAAIASARAAHADATFRVTGEPVLRQQELNDAFSGALYASTLSFILVALSLVLGIRSGRLIIALLITLILGSIWTTGLAALVIGRLNLISVAFLVLFFGLGVDFGTHLGMRHLEEAKKGKPFKDALLASMLGEGPAIVLSAICASLAFLAFVPTSYTGLAEFGIISALGMLVAVVATFTLQPALMALMPPRPKPGLGLTIGIGRFINRYHTGVLVAAALATGIAAYFAMGARVDTNPLNLQNPNTEPVETYLDLARDPETSPYSLDVLSPDLQTARDLVPQLQRLAGVGGVRFVEDFIPADQDAKLAALAEARAEVGDAFMTAPEPKATPTGAELVAAFASARASADAIAAAPEDGPNDPSILAAGKALSAAFAAFSAKFGDDPERLAELGTALTATMPPLVADLRGKLAVSAPVTIADIPPDLRREWIADDGKVRINVRPDHDIGTSAAMKTFFDKVHSVAPQVAGAPASITGAGRAILRAFLEASLYTIIAIGLLVGIMQRRLSDVVLILGPLAVAALWTVAASASLGVPFNFANVIVIPLLIGLGVASSIHIVGRAHQVVRDKAGTHEEGMHVLDTSTPLAVLIAQLNTVAAFATLAVAHHRGLFSMGVLLGVAILFVLIVSLVVLPAFMVAVGIGRPARTGSGARAG